MCRTIILMSVLLLAGCATVKDVGEGMKVGGAGRFESVFGIIIYVVGEGLSMSADAVLDDRARKEGNAGHDERQKKAMNIYVKRALMSRFALKVQTMSASEARNVGKEFCAEMDHLVNSKVSLEFTSEELDKAGLPKHYMPPDDVKKVFYSMHENPFVNCKRDVERTIARLGLLTQENLK